VNVSRELSLDTDREWSEFEGESLRVLEFTPYSSIKNGKIFTGKLIEPYAHAILTLESKKVQGTIKGYVWHKLDFRNLWKVFKERKVQENEEVIIIWTKQNYKYTWQKYVSYFLPKLWIAIYPKGHLERRNNPNLRSEFKDAREALHSLEPIEVIKWEGME
jgi:hypothetical protein